MCCPICVHFPCNMWTEGNNDCCSDCEMFTDCQPEENFLEEFVDWEAMEERA